MLATILSFATPKRLMYGALALILAFFVWRGAAFVEAKYAAEAEVARLEQMVQDYEGIIDLMKREAAQRAAAEAVADATRIAIDAAKDGYEAIQKTIAARKDEEDAEIAPVLRDALLALDGMRTP